MVRAATRAIVLGAALVGFGCKPAPRAHVRHPGAVTPAPLESVKERPPATTERSEPAAPAEEPWVMESLEPEQAAAEAKAAGSREPLNVPSPVKCPPVEPREGAAKERPASGPLAALGLTMDGFLDPEFGLAEAVARFGAPAVCSNVEARNVAYHLVPREANLRGVVVSTDNFAVRGVTLRFDRPVEIDGAELTRVHGPGKDVVSTPDDPIKDRTIEVITKDFRGTITLERAEKDPQSGKIAVQTATFRRTPQMELLPFSFAVEKDLVRLATLALWPGPVNPVRFYGAFGAKESEDEEHVYFGQIALRNVSRATLQRSPSKPYSTRAITVRFRQPVAVGVDSFAEALVKALGAGEPLLAREAEDGRIRVLARDRTSMGEVILRMERGRVREMQVTRAR